MDADLKQKWVEALRSGKFKQGRNLLRDGDKYCCLGVLCKVAGLEITKTGQGVVEPDGEDGSYVPFRRLLGGFSYHNLTERNDSGAGFETIADYIEENL